MNITYLLLSVIALSVLSCNHNKKMQAANVPADITIEKTEEDKMDKVDTARFNAPPPPHQEQTTNVDVMSLTMQDNTWDKKIVREATVNAEIKDFKSFAQAVGQKVKHYGGYISNEQLQHNDYKIENTVVIKIPVAQFDVALNDLLSDVIRVNDRNVSAEDVTGELIDGKARMQAKKEIRQRYLNLLRQARSMKEVLEIQKEINEIQEDIESANGRISFLEHNAAMSTVHFTYYQILDPGAASAEPGFIEKLETAFSQGLHAIGQFLVILVSLWPLVLGAIVLWVLFLKKRLFGFKL